MSSSLLRGRAFLAARGVCSVRVWVAAALCAGAAGCASAPRYVPATPIADEALASGLRDALDGTYPDEFRTVHRVVLSIRGRQFTFTGYLLARRPGHVRLLAAGDLGGTAFEVIRHPSGESLILRSLPGRTGQRVAGNAARDAVRIYFARPSHGAVLTRPSNDAVALADVLPDGTAREFRLDPATSQLRRYLEARRGRVCYEIAFSDYGQASGAARAVPRRISIVDHVGRYRADIRVLELRPATRGAAAFKPER